MNGTRAVMLGPMDPQDRQAEELLDMAATPKVKRTLPEAQIVGADAPRGPRPGAVAVSHGVPVSRHPPSP